MITASFLHCYCPLQKPAAPPPELMGYIETWKWVWSCRLGPVYCHPPISPWECLPKPSPLAPCLLGVVSLALFKGGRWVFGCQNCACVLLWVKQLGRETPKHSGRVGGIEADRLPAVVPFVSQCCHLASQEDAAWPGKAFGQGILQQGQAGCQTLPQP